MSKHIIPFNNKNAWETNSNCYLCSSIDKIYKEIEAEPNEAIKQIRLRFLENECLVDGYKLIHIYESFKRGINLTNHIQKIKQYPNNTQAFMNKVKVVLKTGEPLVDTNENPDFPVLIHSRWCRVCGSLKPSIFDTERDI